MTREEAIKILKAIRVYECYPKSASEETKEAIDMAIEALVDRPTGWIPVSERLPDLKTEVIYSFYGTVSTGYMTDRDYEGEKTESHWEDLESGVTIEPTHWMPLPEPYKGG